MRLTKKLLEKFSNIQSILGLGLLIKLLGYSAYPPFWDAASYISVGKYIFSGGAAGLIEPFRPLVWPIVLGFFWKMGLDPITFGHLIELFLGLGLIGLVYFVGEKIYGRSPALLAALLVAISPALFIWGNSLYTDVPASFLGFLGVYLFLTQRMFFAGLITGLAFFTKFPQILPLSMLVLIFFLPNQESKPSGKQRLHFIIAFVITIIPFFILQQGLYGDLLKPLFDGIKVYRSFTPWRHGMTKCLNLLVLKECPLLFFSLLSLPFIGHGPGRKEKIFVLLAGGASLFWIGKFAIDYLRLAIVALPYLYLLTAEGIWQCQNYLQSSKKNFLFASLWFGLTLGIGNQVWTVSHMHFPENRPSFLQKFVSDHQKELVGERIWVSSPKILVFTNLKAEPLYDPTFNKERIEDLQSRLGEADYILIDSRDLPCNPPDDPFCLVAKDELIARIKQSYEALELRENPALGITVGIFRREGDYIRP